MKTERHESREPAFPAESRPGEILAEARSQLNLSREDVAMRLNLSADTIAALEEEDFGRLPGETFVRGYTRAYARLLGIDETWVVPAVDYGPPASATTDTRRIRALRPARRSRRQSRYAGKILGLLLLVAIVVSWGYTGIPWKSLFESLPFTGSNAEVAPSTPATAPLAAPAGTPAAAPAAPAADNQPQVQIHINRVPD